MLMITGLLIAFIALLVLMLDAYEPRNHRSAQEDVIERDFKR
jgi:hypothetical protein